MLMLLLKAYDRDKFGDHTKIDISKITEFEDISESLLRVVLEHIEAEMQAEGKGALRSCQRCQCNRENAENMELAEGLEPPTL